MRIEEYVKATFPCFFFFSFYSLLRLSERGLSERSRMGPVHRLYPMDALRIKGEYRGYQHFTLGTEMPDLNL